MALEITPETLRAEAQSIRDRAAALREEQRRLIVEAARLDREADVLEEAERLRGMVVAPASARAVLAGEIAAHLARCRKPKSSSEIAAHFNVTIHRARQALDLLAEIGMVYRHGLSRGTRYRFLRDDEDPPNDRRPFGDRWHEYVRDMAIELQTFTVPEITARMPELAPATVQRWLVRLVEDGVLSRERVGTAYVYAYERPQASATTAAEVKADRTRSTPIAGTGRTKYSRTEVGEIIRVAKAAGAEIRKQKHGYAVVVNGETLASVPKTPSDSRSLKNARADLRRNGVRSV